MDNPSGVEIQEPAAPSYEHADVPQHEEVPAYEHAPEYEPRISVRVDRMPAGLNLTIDPAGSSIKTLPSSPAPPLYTFNGSMLEARGTTGSIHVQRKNPNGSEAPLAIYAIGDHFISALVKPRNREYHSVTAARSHGALVTLNIRETLWDFSTRLRAPQGKDVAGNSGYAYPTDPVYMIGTAPGPGTVEKHLLQFRKGKVFDADDEVIALEREGGPECQGMPLLSVIKDLDQEKLDFLVSAWMVTLWGQVGKRARRHSKSDNGTK